MNIVSVFSSLLYSILQITGGLLLHPYQTMQSLVKDRVFVWLTLLPTFFLGLVTISWRLIIVPWVSSFFSCALSGFFLCDYLIFLGNFLSLFCFYWQLMLLYFLIRFSTVFKQLD